MQYGFEILRVTTRKPRVSFHPRILRVYIGFVPNELTTWDYSVKGSGTIWLEEQDLIKHEQAKAKGVLTHKPLLLRFKEEDYNNLKQVFNEAISDKGLALYLE